MSQPRRPPRKPLDALIRLCLMHSTAPVKNRWFSLRWILTWLLLLSLSFAILRLAFSANSLTWFLCGLAVLAVSALALIVTFQRRWRYTVLVAALLLCVYSGVYVSLSFNGRYEASVVGLNGVKWYSWAPLGYVQDYKWNQSLLLTFVPLYYLDTQFWHPNTSSYSGPHPINK